MNASCTQAMLSAIAWIHLLAFSKGLAFTSSSVFNRRRRNCKLPSPVSMPTSVPQTFELRASAMNGRYGISLSWFEFSTRSMNFRTAIPHPARLWKVLVAGAQFAVDSNGGVEKRKVF